MNKKRNRRFAILTFAMLIAAMTSARTHAADSASSTEGVEPQRREWTIDGTQREALIYVPAAAKTAASPVVFAFHGHGGSMNQASTGFGYHKLWPEAIVVYMQGLKTPGKLTDPEGKRTGWQHAAGDQDDRDLKFFDTVLATLKKDYKVDESRIYSTGHSNGGGFTYLLWAERGDVFAAVAPSSAASSRWGTEFTPKPVLHVAGENDTLVKFEWQRLMMDQLLKINHCEKQGTAWEKYCTLYPSDDGAPVVLFIHPGTHRFPAEAPTTIVKFFKQYAKK
jgi:polyhydroxybutyrate depolymerase